MSALQEPLLTCHVMVDEADPFVLLEAPALPVGAICGQLGIPEEETEIDCHDRDMPGP
ncbi:hypothetical protein [Oceanisphaera arctica]|uniref:hypothetical protein n=1 Tax=Oceanisphaera arctica TaxID=641510 RepID=UPI0015E33A04|nr:hypothetical protein [Oceanisphaera arctica]GHA21202.1 hypothetical protein GCM10007082_22560 [Oceanisphaera arctica]